MIPAQHALESADIATSSDDYARRFAGTIGKWMLDVQSEIVIELLSLHQYTSALDVGGGHAQLVEPLQQSGCTVTVLGSAPSCQQQLGEYLKSSRCSFLLGSLTNIPCTDRSYDLTCSIRFISHCKEWQTLIAELCRVARKGVLIDYPPLFSSNLIAPITFRIKKIIEGNTRPFSIFTHREIEREFRKHGFVLDQRMGQFFFPMAIHRLLKTPQISTILEKGADIALLRKYFGSPSLALFVRK